MYHSILLLTTFTIFTESFDGRLPGSLCRLASFSGKKMNLESRKYFMCLLYIKKKCVSVLCIE